MTAISISDAILLAGEHTVNSEHFEHPFGGQMYVEALRLVAHVQMAFIGVKKMRYVCFQIVL